ncbi:4'-phosphopantetheinyl transferase family protein [Candidatus Tisiphia endosymbiont of Temnostethus pusillus]|uniref:4'-phosphopantetheinyl transferase family protein n=1 Tax=Candidatus Tisiphia endosymbiont of Temnostethus pusillus TaxID=3139335 RepID=UPI0035C8AEEC
MISTRQISNTESLKINEVHIWSTYLLENPKDLDLQYSYLSTDEKERAEKFYFARDKIKFIQGRCLLRSIIAGYTGISVNDVQFKYNEYGKPKLKNNIIGLSFNVSHSHELLVLAFTRHNEVGIDIELTKEDDVSWLINANIFTNSEINLFKDLVNSNTREIFYKLWSGKEAYLKALGIGLSIPLNSVEIAFTEDKKIKLVNNRHTSYEPYYLIDLQHIPEQYIGTLALLEQPNHIKYFNKHKCKEIYICGC